MKLLYCFDCNDIFNLRRVKRECTCGKVKGRCIDNTYAITNGQGLCLAIANPDLMTCLRYIRENRVMPIRCWSRPHEGKDNPHTSIGKKVNDPET